MIWPLLRSITALLCVFASIAGAGTRRDTLSDCLVLRQATGLFSEKGTELCALLPDGSEQRLASLDLTPVMTVSPGMLGRNPPRVEGAAVAISPDGRAVVYWASARARKGGSRVEPGIHRYVCGGGDTLLYRAGELRWPARIVGDVMLVGFRKDSLPGPANRMRALIANGGEIPAALLGASPLHAAAFHGRNAEIDSLLESGADPAAQNLFDMSSLDVAIYAGQDDASLRIIHHARADSSLLIGAMRWAIPFGRWKAVKGLLERGVSPNAPYDSSHTPLIGAVENPAVPSFGSRERNLRIDLLDLVPDGPPYGRAMRTRQSIAEGVRLLLDHGADPNRAGPGGFMPLHEIATWSQYGGALEAARLLIERGADLGVTARRGNTPLHTLVARNVPYDEQAGRAMLELFVGHTRNFERRNAAGFTPVERAIGAGNFRAAHYLVEHGAADTTVFFGRSVRKILAENPEGGRRKDRFDYGLWLRKPRIVPHTEPIIPSSSAEAE